MSTNHSVGDRLPRKALIFTIILLLTASSAFALGYLAAQKNQRTPIIIEKGSTLN